MGEREDPAVALARASGLVSAYPVAKSVNLIRQVVLGQLDLAADGQAVIDLLPVPVVKFHLLPSATGDWRARMEPSMASASARKSPGLASNYTC